MMGGEPRRGRFDRTEIGAAMPASDAGRRDYEAAGGVTGFSIFFLSGSARVATSVLSFAR